MKEYPLEYENLVTNNNKYSKTFISNNSTTMRISILEDRTKTLEKMIKLLEERLNMKEEEKLNELKTIESDNAITNKLNKKISSLNEKIKYLEDHLNINKNKENDIKNQNDLNLENLNELIKNNNIQMDELINEKIYNMSIDNENKINELLNLIRDINKILEENENKINSITVNFNKFQNDNIDIIQMISIYEEKIGSIDYLNNEINEIKMRIKNLNTHFDDQYEEEKFAHQYLSSITIK